MNHIPEIIGIQWELTSDMEFCERFQYYLEYYKRKKERKNRRYHLADVVGSIRGRSVVLDENLTLLFFFLESQPKDFSDNPLDSEPVVNHNRKFFKKKTREKYVPHKSP